MNRATSLNVNGDMPRKHVLFHFWAGFYQFMLEHVAIFAKSDLRFSDKKRCTSKRKDQRALDHFSLTSPLCVLGLYPFMKFSLMCFQIYMNLKVSTLIKSNTTRDI